MSFTKVAPAGTVPVSLVLVLSPVKNPLVTSAKQEVELYPAEYLTHISQLDEAAVYLVATPLQP